VLNRRLGTTGPCVTALGYGAAPLGNLYRAVSDAEADAAGFDVPADLRRQWDFSRDGVLGRSTTAWPGSGSLDVVLLAGRYNVLDQSALDDLLPAARRRGTSVVVGGVFGSGVLAHEWPPDDATYDYSPAPRPVLWSVLQEEGSLRADAPVPTGVAA
jgi:aryl-alcohol dehydrogenase-like predicted oxidoreductase